MKKLGSFLLCAALVATPVIAMDHQDVSAKGKTVTVKANGKDKKDDTKAIQSALDKVKKGGTVKIPKGTYYVKCIFIRRNCTLKLSKKTVLKKLKDKKLPRASMIECHLKKKRYGSFSKVTITGGTLDGQMHKDNKKNAHMAIDIDHGSNLTIKNMTIKNFSGLHMIQVAGVKNATFDHLTFKNQYLYNDYSGKSFYKGAKNWSAYTCEALQFDTTNKGQSSAIPADNTTCQNIKVTNCKFDHVLSGLGTHHNETKYYKYMHKNVTATNNTFTNIRGDAMHLNNIKNVTTTNNKGTSGNIFTTYYHSFNVKDSDNVSKKFYVGIQTDQKTTATFDHNQYLETPNVDNTKHATTATFSTISSNVTLSNSTIVGRPHLVVFVGSASGFKMTGCTLDGVTNNSLYGMSAKSDENTVIDGNTVNGQGSWGIVAHGGNYTVQNNTFNGWKIWFGSGANANQVNNTFN